MRTTATRYALLAVLILTGCPDGSAPAPQASPEPQTSPSPQVREEQTAKAPAPTAPSAPATPLRPVLLQPFHRAPALDLEERDGLSLQVDLYSGQATCVEVDGRVDEITLRRARTVEDPRDGLFGRGWFAEVESFVEPNAGGLVVSRPEGFSLFALTSTGDYVSQWGQVETARRESNGYAIQDVDGRTLRFDHEGQLVSITPGYRIVRTKRRLRLIGDRSTVSIDLDADGRAAALRGPGVSLDCTYTNGELAAISGTRTRAYTVEEGRVRRVDTASESLDLAYATNGRLASAQRGAWRQTYAFHSGQGQMARVQLRTSAGSYDYVRTESGWTVDTPRGQTLLLLDGRLRVQARMTSGNTIEDLRGVANVLPGGAVQQSSYDEEGRLVAVEAGGASESYTYNAAGQVASHTTPDGRTTRFEYDANGHVVRERSPAGSLTYTRDALGRMTRLQTPAGRSWSQTWSDGEIVQRDGPMGPVELERSAGGRLLARQDASGRRVSWSVDAKAGVVETVATLAGSTDANASDTMRFGADGNLLAAENADTRIRYAYGADGRLRRTETQVGERTVAVDTVDTLTSHSIETPWGGYRHVYEGGLLTELESPAGTFRFEYDENGQRTSTVYPNGVAAESHYDRLGRIVREVVLHPDANDPVLNLGASWNARHERELDSRDDVETRYGYDRAGRLSSVQKAGEASVHYRYDADGNRTLTRSGGDATAASYDERGRLVSEGDDTFHHDASGRLVERTHARGVDRFAYDAHGRLIRAERAKAPAVSYGYDALGRMASRTTNGETTRYVYEGTRLLAEISPSRERVFVYGPGIDEPLAYTDGDGWVFLHSNDLGHVLAYTDADGAPVARAAFDPFGQVQEAPGAHPTFFAGRPYDVDARIYPMRARCYDPSLGRFLTADPSYLKGGFNAYTYVENRPLDYVDPLGTYSVPGWLKRRGIAGGLMKAVSDGFGAAEKGLELLRYELQQSKGPAVNSSLRRGARSSSPFKRRWVRRSTRPTRASKFCRARPAS